MSSEYPSDLLYTKEHEWARMRGNVAVIGVTRFAVEQLGDVTQLELPAEGDSISRDQVFGTIESVKAVSDLFAPLSGKVVKVNTALHDKPEAINDAPYGEGWIIEVEVADAAEVDQLLKPDAYQQLIAEQD